VKHKRRGPGIKKPKKRKRSKIQGIKGIRELKGNKGKNGLKEVLKNRTTAVMNL